MSKYAQGKFVPKHPEKYIGKSTPTYRSSWEFVFMQFADNNPAIIQWASEGLKIPYRNPVTGKQSVYVPDFLVVYLDKNMKQHTEVIEIKPLKETTMETARSPRDKLMVAINMAKWAAAQQFCRAHNMFFRVVNETQIFSNLNKRK